MSRQFIRAIVWFAAVQMVQFAHIATASQPSASYDSASNQASMSTVLLNGVSYPSVVVKVGGLVSIGGGNPIGTVNTYDASLNQGTVPSVIVDGQATYTNVVFTPGQIVAVGNPFLQPTERSVAFKFRGFNFSAFDATTWNVYADNVTALTFAKNLGSNTVTLDWMIPFADDGTIAPAGGGITASIADIANVITLAKSMGFYVILKPHVISTTCCGQNRNSTNTNINTFLPSNFFPAWQTYLVSTIANLPMGSVDAIAIGTELDIIDWQFRPQWASLIQAVRNVYKGPLTYDAMFNQYNGGHDIATVVFWDLLDFISCSFYVRLTSNDGLDTPSIANLMRNNPAVTVNDAIGKLSKISAQYGKEVFVMEGGYQSANGALWGVNDFYDGLSAIQNQDLQSRGFDAYLFALNFNQGSWLRGVTLWDLQSRYVRSYSLNDPNYRTGWGVYNKSAADTIKKWFSIP